MHTPNTEKHRTKEYQRAAAGGSKAEHTGVRLCLGSGVALSHTVPVDQVVDKVGQEVGAAVLHVQVVGVLPHCGSGQARAK